MHDAHVLLKIEKLHIKFPLENFKNRKNRIKRRFFEVPPQKNVKYEDL